MNNKIRNWLYPLLSVIAVVAVVLSLANYKTKAHHYEECTRAANIAALNDFELNTTIDPDYKPQKTQQNSQNISNQISCSDLSAQWAMSDIAMMGYIAGLLGLVFLGITVYETKSAADLTRKALRETKDNSRRELRAYVHAVPYALNLTTTGKVPTVVLRIFNKGQTPAINIQCEVSASMDEDEKPIVEDKFPVKVSIAPDSHEDIIWPLSESDMEENWNVRMYFKIQYSDIFGFERFVSLGLNISKSIFPNTAAILFQRNKIRSPTSTDINKIPFLNPAHKSEVMIPYVSYSDDLQKEAEEYAEKNT